LHLAPEKLEEFRRRGWTTVEGVFSVSAVDAIAELAVSLCEQELASNDSSYFADRSAAGKVVPRKLDHPFLRHRDLRIFVLSPRLRGLVDQFIGTPPLLLADQIFMKPPRFGSAKPYHQDNAYFRCHPDDQVLTAWIALDDVNESNGCLRYIDGSHRGPILEHVPVPGEPYNQAPTADQIDLSREAPACVGKGGVVFHHSKALHTSHRNESDRWRRAYATHWVGAEVTSEGDRIETAHYNRHPELYEEALAATLQGAGSD